MSDRDRSEVTAFHELQVLVRHLGDELAAFRHRALVAESRLRELERSQGRPAVKAQREAADRSAELERENAELKERLEAATARTRQMLERVRFIRQQTQATAGGSER